MFSRKVDEPSIDDLRIIVEGGTVDKKQISRRVKRRLLSFKSFEDPFEEKLQEDCMCIYPYMFAEVS